MTVREQFEAIGFVFGGTCFALNFSVPCYKMTRDHETIIICESLNQVGFDFACHRMIQPICIAIKWFTKK